MSQSSGAYGEADATEQKNEQHNNQSASSASTDATLNARAKSPKSILLFFSNLYKLHLQPLL